MDHLKRSGGFLGQALTKSQEDPEPVFPEVSAPVPPAKNFRFYEVITLSWHLAISHPQRHSKGG